MPSSSCSRRWAGPESRTRNEKSPPSGGLFFCFGVASEQVAARRKRALHAVAHAADLEDQAVDFRSRQATVRTVLAQLQVGHAIEVADREVAYAAFPVEGERAAAVDAGRRRDRGADPQVAALVVVLHLRQEDRLVATTVLQRQLDAD